MPITYLRSPTATPILHKATLVGIFPKISFHSKCSGFRGVFKFQRYINIGIPFITLYVDFTVKIYSLSPFNNHLLVLSFLGILFAIIFTNCCSCTFSQTNLFLIHTQLPSIHSPKSSMF